MKKGKKLIPILTPGGMNPAPIIVDPMGSYTGRPLDLEEKPVQDADDL